MYSNDQGDLPRNSSDKDVHYKRIRIMGTQKYLRKSCYHRIECTAATFLAAFPGLNKQNTNGRVV